MDLQDIVKRWAFINPVVAYWLMKATPQPKDFKLSVTFTDGTAKAPLVDTLSRKLNCDYFVSELAYSVRQPQALFEGNVFGSLDRLCRAALPPVSVKLSGISCNATAITDGFTPLELVANGPFGSPRARSEFVLLGNASLEAEMQLDDTLTSADVPLTVTLVTRGYLLPCLDLGNVDEDLACYHLARAWGVPVPRSTDALAGIGKQLEGGR